MNINKVKIKKYIVSIFLGQLLSIFICGTAITSGILIQYEVTIPTGQSTLNYVLLALIFTPILIYKGLSHFLDIVKERFWKYILLAILEVEANYLILKSYQFTTVTSVQLLDVMTVPTVLLLSKFILKYSFRWPHYVGVLLCLSGASLLVVSDHIMDRFQEQNATIIMSDRIIGDCLCIGGAILYGISNVAQEYLVSQFGNVEYLSLLSFFASFISAFQFILLEWKNATNIDFMNHQIYLPFLIFVLCLFSFYVLMSYSLQITSAMAINLNLLSSDFFSLIIGIYFFKYQFHVLYFVAYVVIMLGIIGYNLKSLEKVTNNSRINICENPQNELQVSILNEISLKS